MHAGEVSAVGPQFCAFYHKSSEKAQTLVNVQASMFWCELKLRVGTVCVRVPCWVPPPKPLKAEVRPRTMLSDESDSGGVYSRESTRHPLQPAIDATCTRT